MYDKLIILAFFYCFWIYTQKQLANDHAISGEITDRLHGSHFFIKLHEYLTHNPTIARRHAIATSLLLDLHVGIMLLNAYFYDEYKPVYIFFIGIVLRQFCQFINRLPMPKDIIWKNPNFPSVLVTYDITNDLFFSGHTFTAMCIGMNLWDSSYLAIQLYGLFIILYEAFYVLITRSHYFMDVYAAITTYFAVRYFFEQ